MRATIGTLAVVAVLLAALAVPAWAGSINFSEGNGITWTGNSSRASGTVTACTYTNNTSGNLIARVRAHANRNGVFVYSNWIDDGTYTPRACAWVSNATGPGGGEHLGYQGWWTLERQT